ncbi:MAG: uroporphyrinogen decarboxylase family protein [Thermodesulfobacteriota bacterium]
MNTGTVKIFPEDGMSAEERFETAVRLGVPDRVPLSLMLYYFAPLYAKVPMSRYMADAGTYARVMEKVWEEVGPWDVYYNIRPVSRLIYSYVMMMRTLWPGYELAEDEMAKVEEMVYMRPEDYDRVMDGPGFLADTLFRLRMLGRFCKEAEGADLPRLTGRMLVHLVRQIAEWRRDFRWWRRRGAAIQMGCQAEMPFDTFSQARNVVNFSLDLMKTPEKVGRAATKLAESYADFSVFVARLMGVPRVQCYCHRTSNSFISPKQFQELALPGLEIVVNRIVEAGMTPILHCDGDWLKNLPAMRRLPAGKAVIQLDGLTDIFRAKEIMGGHSCLFGDVPAALLVEGTPSEVLEYCHRLIEEVGRGGGFVLAAGCEVPPNARPDCVRAMRDAVRRYGYYGKPGSRLPQDKDGQHA